MIRLLLVALVIILPLSLLAQRADTTRSSASVDSAARIAPRKPAQELVFTKSPTLATLLGIVPGLGQAYNEQYWKIPIFGGAAAYFGVRAFLANRQYKNYAALAETDRSYVTLREAYHNDRDLFIAYAITIQLLSMVDSYVGANMFDFDVGDDISTHLQLMPQGVGLSVRF